MRQAKIRSDKGENVCRLDYQHEEGDASCYRIRRLSSEQMLYPCIWMSNFQLLYNRFVSLYPMSHCGAPLMETSIMKPSGTISLTFSRTSLALSRKEGWKSFSNGGLGNDFVVA